MVVATLLCRMSLLHADWGTRLIQERTVSVPEDVPSKSRNPNADLLKSGLEDLLLNGTSVVAAARDWGREDKIVCAVTLPIEEDLCKRRVMGHVVVGCLQARSAAFGLQRALLDRHANVIAWCLCAYLTICRLGDA